MLRPLLSVLAVVAAACASAPEPVNKPLSNGSSAPAPGSPSGSAAAGKPAPMTALATVQSDAKKLDALVTSPIVKAFLAATDKLPHIETRALYHTKDKEKFFSACDYEGLSQEQRAQLVKISADEELYYNTKYGTPLSYARPFDLLAARGVTFAPKSKYLDFGYGYVGHLRLLASLGVEAVGVDVDPMLPALYGEVGDQGVIENKGSVRLIDGMFPKDAKVVASVGKDYDVIVSKNVLKKGYIHPDRPVDDPKKQVHLEVPDDVVLKAFFDALKPGGLFMVYNICPAPTPPDKPFVPWSDGRSPWTRAQWEAAGFKVLEIDHDDYAAVNKMAHVLGWGDDPDEKWDIDHDLSVLYTLVQRP